LGSIFGSEDEIGESAVYSRPGNKFTGGVHCPLLYPAFLPMSSAGRASNATPMLKSSSPPSVETRTSWVVAAVVLVIMAVAFGAPWITVVALKDIAAEIGGERSVPAFASALMWIGSGVGSILMGRVAERIGIRFTGDGVIS
jgi:hypothetical protein